MASREPNQEEVTNYFKAMAEGKLQGEDVGSIGKIVGGRSNRVIHYRMTYPSGPVNLPIQNVTSEVAQSVDQAKAELGIKGKTLKKKPKSYSSDLEGNIFLHPSKHKKRKHRSEKKKKSKKHKKEEKKKKK